MKTSPENTPTVQRYDLYTRDAATAMPQIASESTTITAQVVPVESLRNRIDAAEAWSAQCQRHFEARQSQLPEPARAKRLPGIYTVERMFETLGRTRHIFMQLEAANDEEIKLAQSAAIKLMNGREV